MQKQKWLNNRGYTYKMNTKQLQIINELAKKYGENITLKELLAMKDKTDIADVEFNIKGHYIDAYECTGDIVEYKGTIKEILINLAGWYCIIHPKNTDYTEGTPLKDMISAEELNELAKFYFGARKADNQLEVTEVISSRGVTHEEVMEYLSTIEVTEDFEYCDTIIGEPDEY